MVGSSEHLYTHAIANALDGMLAQSHSKIKPCNANPDQWLG